MKRFLPLLIVSFLFLTSCAQGWNIVFPDSSSELAKKTGTNYTGATSSYRYSDYVTGTLYNGSSFTVYRFLTSSGTNTYYLNWENFGTARLAVDVSESSSFSSNNFYSGSVTSPISIRVTGSRYIYIKVRPANGSSSNTGNYKLTVGGNSGSISLTRYN